MFRVSREIDFCYGHRLLNYQGKCRHLHGHNGRAIVTVEAAGLDDRGMVLDFGDIKTVISRWIDEHLDHRMILCRDDPAVPVLEKLGEPLYLIDANPTAENIAKLIYDCCRPGLSRGGSELWETPALPRHLSPAAAEVPSPSGRWLMTLTENLCEGTVHRVQHTATIRTSTRHHPDDTSMLRQCHSVLSLFQPPHVVGRILIQNLNAFWPTGPPVSLYNLNPFGLVARISSSFLR